MRNYIKAELYRISHSTTYPLSILVFILFSMASVFLGRYLPVDFTEDKFLFILKLLMMIFVASPYVILMFLEITLDSELEHKTINNAISSGISRRKIILSKIFVLSFISMVFSLLVIGSHILMLKLAYGTSPEGIKFLKQLSLAYISCIPIWIGLSAFMTIFSSLIESNILKGMIIFCTINILPSILVILSNFKPKLGFLYDIQVNVKLNQITGLLEKDKFSKIDLGLIGYGIVFTIITTLISMFLFEKKDY